VQNSSAKKAAIKIETKEFEIPAPCTRLCCVDIHPWPPPPHPPLSGDKLQCRVDCPESTVPEQNLLSSSFHPILDYSLA